MEPKPYYWKSMPLGAVIAKLWPLNMLRLRACSKTPGKITRTCKILMVSYYKLKDVIQNHPYTLNHKSSSAKLVKVDATVHTKVYLVICFSSYLCIFAFHCTIFPSIQFLSTHFIWNAYIFICFFSVPSVSMCKASLR